MSDIDSNHSNVNFDDKHNSFKKKLYAVDLPRFEKQASVSYLREGELGCVNIDNGIILPLRKTDIPALNAIYEGGVCDEEFNFIAGHIRNDNGKHNNFEVVRSYETENIGYLDEEVIFAGVAFDHFGHFIVESMVRLWWVIKEKKFDQKIVFLKNIYFEAAYLELLEIIGIKKKNILFLDKPTKFRNIIVPEQSLIFSSHYYKEFSLPYDAILKEIKPSRYKNIYLSRTQFRKKDCINEEYFEEFYRKMGYKIIYPEQLDIKEQISIVYGADEIVSTIGTISHLALFAKKSAKIITLLRARNFFSNVQAMINQSRDLDYTFVDVTCNFLPYRYSASCYYIGPNASWNNFIKQEYGMKPDVELFEYLNSRDAHIGDYFRQWLNVFSNKKQLKKIQNDNSLNLLRDLEVIFSHNLDEFSPKSEKVREDLSQIPKRPSRFSEKIFSFSRYDGSYAREIRLNKSGLIETIQGKDNRNESFWEIENNELVFLDINRKVTSRYFCVKEKERGLFLLGYYERNKEIIFKLEETEVTSLRAVKKN